MSEIFVVVGDSYVRAQTIAQAVNTAEGFCEMCNYGPDEIRIVQWLSLDEAKEANDE